MSLLLVLVQVVRHRFASLTPTMRIFLWSQAAQHCLLPTNSSLAAIPMWTQAVQHCCLSMSSVVPMNSVCLAPLVSVLLWRQAV